MVKIAVITLACTGFGLLCLYLMNNISHEPLPYSSQIDLKPDQVKQAYSRKPLPYSSQIDLKPDPVKQAYSRKPLPYTGQIDLKPDPVKQAYSRKPLPYTSQIDLKPDPVKQAYSRKPLPYTSQIDLKPEQAIDQPAILVIDTSKNLTAEHDNIAVAKLMTDPAINICIYEEKHSASGSILKRGIWEKEIGQMIMSTLQSLGPVHTPCTVGLIDIGASIGVHMLPAAKKGYCVVAVEPSAQNIMHIQKAININSINPDSIVLLNNALSNERGQIHGYSRDKKAVAANGTALQSIVSRKTRWNVPTEEFSAIYMDDLLNVTQFRKAVLKIDIEGAEPMAFAKAERLFTEIDICEVYMEFGHSKQLYWTEKHAGEKGVRLMNDMVDFFYRHGYTACTSDQTMQPLSREHIMSWPWDVMWRKTTKP